MESAASSVQRYWLVLGSREGSYPSGYPNLLTAIEGSFFGFRRILSEWGPFGIMYFYAFVVVFVFCFVMLASEDTRCAWPGGKHNNNGLVHTNCIGMLSACNHHVLGINMPSPSNVDENQRCFHHCAEVRDKLNLHPIFCFLRSMLLVNLTSDNV